MISITSPPALSAIIGRAGNARTSDICEMRRGAAQAGVGKPEADVVIGHCNGEIAYPGIVFSFW